MPSHPESSYKPLKNPKEIRLRQIEPSLGPTHSSLPNAKLIHSTLGEGEIFSALSYVWGTEFDSTPLICNGGKIRITKNLGQALRQLQHDEQSRRIWIDALCINQENIPERNHQLTLMSDIYGTAKQVLVWLGPDNENQAGRLCAWIESVGLFGVVRRRLWLCESEERMGRYNSLSTFRSKRAVMLRSIPLTMLSVTLAKPESVQMVDVQEPK
ncbi:hypothetical protein EPUS_03028 [Endocarpon pusillum Z07020]|nr:uncharacterized protein EPUS_03028 [Endocarpon pusillum Z07020]ERF73187.1 hypothetical protein EPUS_03028 [Endocarpon pusillum Z07020]